MNPARANRLRHPTARLLAEYFWGYVAAIRRAPLSPADRRECYRNLTQWMLDRAVSKVLPRRLGRPRISLHADHSQAVSHQRSWPARGGKVAVTSLRRATQTPRRRCGAQGRHVRPLRPGQPR